MKTVQGRLEEIFMDGSAGIVCPPELIPHPGQYLHAHADGSASPLAVSLFPSLISPSGFRSAPVVPASWRPGDVLHLRGPIGRGFSIPPASKRIAMVAFDDSPSRLRALLPIALKQNAEIVLVCDSQTGDLPEIVEVQPMNEMIEILHWADYAAFDVDRENLNRLRERLAGMNQAGAGIEAQVLIRSAMPCGGIADCGVCALTLRHDWKMICKDGPVFDLREIK
jgi:dihydroorotate dehydrogenase electron transfer subunit